MAAADFLLVLLYAALPALGNMAGGLMAERMHVSPARLSLALHAAAGVVIAIVAVEIMPEALKVASPWLVLGAFVLGGLLLLGVERATRHVTARFGGGAKSASAWVIFAGVAIDLFSDGLMIGAGSTIGLGLGLLLALGQIPADVPQGFATMATFKRQRVPRRTRLLLLAGLAVPMLLGATLGYFAMRGQAEALKMAVLALTAGALTTLVVEEIVPEAHEGEEGRLAGLFFLGGFALFSAVSFLFG